jgi:hypothetical protein
MSYRRSWILLTVVILGLFMFIPIAQAQRQEFENIACVANTTSTVQASPGEIYIGTFEGKGIVRSVDEKKLFDNNTFHQVGVQKAVGGKWIWNGFYKAMRPDGDFIIWEFSGDSEIGTTAKAIYGAGKFKGVKGEVKSKMLTKGKPIVEGTSQNCSQVVGWIELPK